MASTAIKKYTTYYKSDCKWRLVEDIKYVPALRLQTTTALFKTQNHTSENVQHEGIVVPLPSVAWQLERPRMRFEKRGEGDDLSKR